MNIQQSVDFLRGVLPDTPEVGIVLGSGLGPLAEQIEAPVCIPYGNIPHFKTATAPDHAGRFVYGSLSGKRVLCMQGRLHGYEGHSPQDIAYPVYVMKALGVQALVLTNASGGVNTDFSVGDFCMIDDHINMTGKSPLTGENDQTRGTRFPDMTFAYAPKLKEKLLQAARVCDIPIRRGIYCGVNGPQFETPAEIRAFRAMGADAVGMSTVFEAIAAAHCGLPTVAVAMITNMAAGVLMQPLSGAEVNEIAARKGQTFRMLIAKLVEFL